MKIVVVFSIICSCNALLANNYSSLLLPSLFEGAPLFSNTNIAQQSRDQFRFQLLYENRFLLGDLSPKFISFEKSFIDNNWTLSFSDWGSKYYRERGGQLNYAMLLSPKLSVGVGALIHVVSKFNNDKSLVQFYPAFGIQYYLKPQSKFFTSIQIGMNNIFSYKAHAGYCHEFILSYKLFFLVSSTPDEKLYLSAGVKHFRESGNEFVLQLNSKNYPVAVAYRLKWNHFSLRLSMYYHLQLGMSNHVGVGYQSIP